MKFEAIIEEWNLDHRREEEKEVVFDNIKEYILGENFLIVVAENGTHHAIRAHVVKKFTVTQ